MARAVLITGGNRDDQRRLLEEACRLIGEQIGSVTAASAHYESEPWGFEAEASFWNQVVEVETSLEPEELLNATQRIEQQLGRDRTAEAREKQQSGQRYASRAMDVDILLYDDRVVSSERLTIPHPRMAERTFVLRPLCELMPHRRHPLTGECFGDLLRKLENEK